MKKTKLCKRNGVHIQFWADRAMLARLQEEQIRLRGECLFGEVNFSDTIRHVINSYFRPQEMQ